MPSFIKKGIDIFYFKRIYQEQGSVLRLFKMNFLGVEETEIKSISLKDPESNKHIMLNQAIWDSPEEDSDLDDYEKYQDMGSECASDEDD